MQKENIRSYLKKLISFKTVTSDKQESYKCLQYVSSILKKKHISHTLSSNNGYYYLSSAYSSTKPVDYVFIGHIDVVPAESLTAFEATEKENKIYGRGAIDMKGEDASMLELYTSLYSHKNKVNLSLILTSDEEIGGFNGVKYLVDSGNISGKCAFVPDSGFPDALSINEKGIIHVKLMSRGVSAHGSRPWLGVNAIEKLFDCYREIKKIMPKASKDNNWVPTVNLGQITGGNATNTVASSASMNLDFRYRNNKDYKLIINCLKKTTNKYSSTFEIIITGSPVNIDPKNKYIKKMVSVGKEFNITFKYNYAHGASDARHLMKLNIPIIMFRPHGSEAHVSDEWVDLKSLFTFTDIIKKYILTLHE